MKKRSKLSRRRLLRLHLGFFRLPVLGPEISENLVLESSKTAVIG